MIRFIWSIPTTFLFYPLWSYCAVSSRTTSSWCEQNHGSVQYHTNIKRTPFSQSWLHYNKLLIQSCDNNHTKWKIPRCSLQLVAKIWIWKIFSQFSLPYFSSMCTLAITSIRWSIRWKRPLTDILQSYESSYRHHLNNANVRELQFMAFNTTLAISKLVLLIEFHSKLCPNENKNKKKEEKKMLHSKFNNAVSCPPKRASSEPNRRSILLSLLACETFGLLDGIVSTLENPDFEKGKFQLIRHKIKAIQTISSQHWNDIRFTRAK